MWASFGGKILTKHRKAPFLAATPSFLPPWLSLDASNLLMSFATSNLLYSSI
jgi:hypothetical protein